jgi:heptosyltransferase-2
MVRPSAAAVFAGAPFVDKVWSEPRAAGIAEWVAVVRKVRRARYDMAVLFPNSFESAAMAFLGGVRQRVGYAMDSRGWMLTHGVRGEKRKIHHVDYYLALAKAAGADIGNPCGTMEARPEDRTNARKLLASEGIPIDAGYLVLSPGAAFGSAKRWNEEGFAAAADALGAEFGLFAVTIGSEGERPSAERVRAAAKRPVTVLNGRTSLETLIGVIAGASVLLGNDSGPVHIAAALGIPTVAVFGATDYRVAAPFSPRGRAVYEPVECSPCWLRECPIDHRCMTRVTPEAVCRAAREVMLA